jgi:hypothetical protein
MPGLESPFTDLLKGELVGAVQHWAINCWNWTNTVSGGEKKPPSLADWAASGATDK